MIDFFISKKNKEILVTSEKNNTDEMLSWKLPNLIFPIVVICFSMLSFLIFKDKKLITTLSFFNLLVNGSLPMVALNRLSSLGINLFKFDKSSEKNNSKINTYNLRITILYYSIFFIFGIAIFYAYQVIYTPFNDWINISIQILLAIYCIRESIKISKYGYLLQEKLLERTLGDEIKETAKEQKKHLSEKYD